jgi:hypothetical protein
MQPVAEARDGTWTVGDAGEVDFVIRDGALHFGDVREYRGWTPALRRVEEEALELEFVGSGVTWEFTAHYHRGVLRVAQTKTVDLAEPGRYTVGSAGEVEVGVADGAPTLEEVTPAEGWEVSVDDESPEELTATFSREPLVSTFAARLDAGQLQIDIGYEVASPVPPDVGC